MSGGPGDTAIPTALKEHVAATVASVESPPSAQSPVWSAADEAPARMPDDLSDLRPTISKELKDRVIADMGSSAGSSPDFSGTPSPRHSGRSTPQTVPRLVLDDTVSVPSRLRESTTLSPYAEKKDALAIEEASDVLSPTNPIIQEESSATKNLLGLKKAQGLSFNDLGKRLDRSPLYVSCLLHGIARCKASDLSKLASALSTSRADVRDLLDNARQEALQRSVKSQDRLDGGGGGETDPESAPNNLLSLDYAPAWRALLAEEFKARDGISLADDSLGPEGSVSKEVESESGKTWAVLRFRVR